MQPTQSNEAASSIVADASELLVGASVRLRQLAHDLRSPLSILSMGVETLKALRSDKEQFDMVCEMLLSDGIEPMKLLINQVAEESERLQERK